MKDNITRIIVGVCFIGVGVVFAGNIFNLWDIEVLFDGWWTLFIIVPSALGLLKKEVRWTSVVGLAIGIVLLLSAQDVLPSGMVWKLMFPIIFIGIGLQIIFQRSFAKRSHEYSYEKVNNGKIPNYTAIFGGQEINFAHEAFYGMETLAVFGGVEVNLKQAIITQDVVIKSTNIFGGTELVLPSNVNVKVSSVPVFGGISNKSVFANDPTIPTVYIEGVCIFGGVEIK